MPFLHSWKSASTMRSDKIYLPWLVTTSWWIRNYWRKRKFLGRLWWSRKKKKRKRKNGWHEMRGYAYLRRDLGVGLVDRLFKDFCSDRMQLQCFCRNPATLSLHVSRPPFHLDSRCFIHVGSLHIRLERLSARARKSRTYSQGERRLIFQQRMRRMYNMYLA